MNILVTGDSGFIGSYLTDDLVRSGHRVAGLDIEPAKKHPVRYPYVTGDIRDAAALASVEGPLDCIIHLAAAHRDFGVTREEYYSVNVEGMRSLLRFADERGIRRFFFYSTVAVYGDNQPSTEETAPAPVNHYGDSKLEAEAVLREWQSHDPERQVIILRPAVVFGPLNTANIFKLVRQVCDRRFIWVGDGNNVKSIAYVGNITAVTLFLLERMAPGTAVYNYSDEPNMTTRELVGLISRLSGAPVSRVHIPLSAAVAAANVFDLLGRVTGIDFPVTGARLRKFNTPTEHRSGKVRSLGFVPPFSLEEGLRRNIEWYRTEYRPAAATVQHSDE